MELRRPIRPPAAGRKPLGALSVLLALASGLALRLDLLPLLEPSGDPEGYGAIARNLLLHGQYAFTTPDGALHPTLARLPGYPFFLALCFRLFGMENYAAAAWLQIPIELAGCLLLADCARRIAPPALATRAAHATLWLAALCPFTALYSVQPLTESLTLFSIALALHSVACFRQRPAWLSALGFTFAVTYAALLRPDGALLGFALLPALLFYHRAAAAPAKLARIILVCLLLALAPFAAWTARNWRVFRVAQPLAPRCACDPGKPLNPGWHRWVRSWSLDFVSTFEVYWQVPGRPLDLSLLPRRAFDSPAQYAETAALTIEYNRDHRLTPQLDARFGQLADQRIQAQPVRYYLWLPLGRLADMTLRPRIESFYDDLDWWVTGDNPFETRLSWLAGALNLVYLLLAIAGLYLRPKLWPWMLGYFALRAALLLTIEAPEARYTLEFFPMLFLLGGIALSKAFSPLTPSAPASAP